MELNNLRKEVKEAKEVKKAFANKRFVTSEIKTALSNFITVDEFKAEVAKLSKHRGSLQKQLYANEADLKNKVTYLQKQIKAMGKDKVSNAKLLSEIDRLAVAVDRLAKQKKANIALNGKAVKRKEAAIEEQKKLIHEKPKKVKVQGKGFWSKVSDFFFEEYEDDSEKPVIERVVIEDKPVQKVEEVSEPAPKKVVKRVRKKRVTSKRQPHEKFFIKLDSPAKKKEDDLKDVEVKYDF